MLTAGTTMIGVTPTLIDGREVNPFRIRIHNNDNATNIYLGGSAVSINNGFLLVKESSLDLVINPLEELYAISDKAGHVISWLKQTE